MPKEQQPAQEEPASSIGGAAPAQEPSEGFVQKLKALFGVRPSSLRESLEDVLDEEESVSDTLSAKERTMLRNVLGLRDLRVDDVMVPRADIDAVDASELIGEMLKEFREAGHSRLPVYRETLDDTIGMVHIKDSVSWMTTRAEVDETDPPRRRSAAVEGLDLRKVSLKTTLAETNCVRKVLYVPPSMPAVDLLVKMQATRIHMAVVVDEYGGTDGLVSIEDLVEEIVGDIEDEHDEESAPMIVPTTDGGYIADARATIEELGEALGEGFQVGDLAEDVDTLGGLVFNSAGRVPVRGELVTFSGGFEFEILEADPRRVKRVRIHRRGEAGEPPMREQQADQTDAA